MKTFRNNKIGPTLAIPRQSQRWTDSLARR